MTLIAVVVGGTAACGPPPTVIVIRSASHSFTPATTLVAADHPFRIRYINNDGTAQHNLAIYGVSGEAIAKSADVVGPTGTTEMDVPALAAGTYQVRCDIHPFMTAVLVAKQPR